MKNQKLALSKRNPDLPGHLNYKSRINISQIASMTESSQVGFMNDEDQVNIRVDNAGNSKNRLIDLFDRKSQDMIVADRRIKANESNLSVPS